MIYYVKVSLIAKKEKGCLVLYFGTLTYFVVGTYRTKHNAGLGDTFSRIKLSHRHRSTPLLMEKYFPFQGIEPTGVVIIIRTKSGYGRRVTIETLCVRIPAPDTGRHLGFLDLGTNLPSDLI